MEFRKISPIRTCKEVFTSYRKYKPYLRDDFKKRCGYVNCSDFWFGGSRTFHIDHFKPKSKFPELETTYSNLVYCCSYVNILKTDDEEEYLDPCDINYNEHFERDNDGNIYPINESDRAKYMYGKLKLYLKRYQIIWMLDELSEKIDLLGDIINKGLGVSDDVKRMYIELNLKFHKYRKFLSQEQ
ncbi:hypothetical protein KRE47_00155 [Elizabethkingia meningoseptica]|uniref:hypothetical protein n=1 Tax=Elizabethkingia meningoseptica TaxID=238 RepID=UPI0023B13738|nr:hypothetical protein [Elizabethkingia meningoseptica]MDE5467415.1 hypothetical protein [Elizabethkingia meningoseptica]MDE5473355.1 hypothetical protein [Elizabethkingia meningoseptica]MDE5476788.1 hypothetical protein [Elizabethkingia meningoseptica]MDE5484734.1 hypothetical protein [Elizabethkingia meningoseptica]MDE5500188.1 hypothetical protein [Elizabethkingia meningoseptica]